VGEGILGVRWIVPDCQPIALLILSGEELLGVGASHQRGNGLRAHHLDEVLHGKGGPEGVQELLNSLRHGQHVDPLDGLPSRLDGTDRPGRGVKGIGGPGVRHQCRLIRDALSALLFGKPGRDRHKETVDLQRMDDQGSGQGLSALKGVLGEGADPVESVRGSVRVPEDPTSVQVDGPGVETPEL
jgi:hypothetical protein